MLSILANSSSYLYPLTLLHFVCQIITLTTHFSKCWVQPEARVKELAQLHHAPAFLDAMSSAKSIDSLGRRMMDRKNRRLGFHFVTSLSNGCNTTGKGIDLLSIRCTEACGVGDSSSLRKRCHIIQDVGKERLGIINPIISVRM